MSFWSRNNKRIELTDEEVTQIEIQRAQSAKVKEKTKKAINAFDNALAELDDILLAKDKNDRMAAD